MDLMENIPEKNENKILKKKKKMDTILLIVINIMYQKTLEIIH